MGDDRAVRLEALKSRWIWRNAKTGSHSASALHPCESIDSLRGLLLDVNFDSAQEYVPAVTDCGDRLAKEQGGARVKVFTGEAQNCPNGVRVSSQWSGVTQDNRKSDAAGPDLKTNPCIRGAGHRKVGYEFGSWEGLYFCDSRVKQTISILFHVTAS